MKLGIGRLLVLPLLAAALAACPPTQGPKTVTVVCYDPDAGEAGLVEDLPFEADQSAEAAGRATPCARACASLSLLHCPESRQKTGGFTCIEACSKLVKISTFDPECVARAKAVAAVRQCPQVVCKL